MRIMLQIRISQAGILPLKDDKVSTQYGTRPLSSDLTGPRPSARSLFQATAFAEQKSNRDGRKNNEWQLVIVAFIIARRAVFELSNNQRLEKYKDIPKITILTLRGLRPLYSLALSALLKPNRAQLSSCQWKSRKIYEKLLF